MTVTQKLEKKIESLPSGNTFKYDSLNIQPQEYSAASKAMERLIKKGTVKRVSTGLFYKPKETVFGELRPKEEELIKPYLFKDGKRIAYVTGSALYNRLGLTTQVPKTIQIASRIKRIYINNEKVKAKPVKSYVEVSEDNYKLLELLDALKDFGNISDLDKKSGIKILRKKINALSKRDRAKLIRYALKYPPRARALLGAILMGTNNIEISKLEKLKSSLNPLSNYDLGLSKNILKSVQDWNIE